MQDGTIAGNARFLLQHALATPTVNFASSLNRSFREFANDPPPISLPRSFFINSEALSHVGIHANAALQVPYALYRETLKECAPPRLSTCLDYPKPAVLLGVGMLPCPLDARGFVIRNHPIWGAC